MVECCFGSKANWLTAPPEDETKTFSDAPNGTKLGRYFGLWWAHGASCGLDACDAIDGVYPESRMGARYSSPSFSYGGYCLKHQAAAGELQGRAAGPDRAIVDACCAAYVRNLFKGD